LRLQIQLQQTVSSPPGIVGCDQRCLEDGDPPKVEIEFAVASNLVESAVGTIVISAKTGKIGDGKTFLAELDDAIRIRNAERGEAAL